MTARSWLPVLACVGLAAPGPAWAQRVFPAPESQGGWRKLTAADAIRETAGMDPVALEELGEWLRRSDDREFAAVIVRRGQIVLEVERGRSAKSSAENIKSCAKAICATLMAIAADQAAASRHRRPFSFASPAFEFLPWAKPWQDSAKSRVTVRQLLDHTSGITPELTGARNEGPWEKVLSRPLDFEPGTRLEYSSYAYYHAALVLEGATGVPYDQFAIEHLFKPLGIETWWFEHFEGAEPIGRHPNHTLGLPAREMARIGLCLARGGEWSERRVVPASFVAQTAAPQHGLRWRKDSRFRRDVESFSLGWPYRWPRLGVACRPTGQGGFRRPDACLVTEP
jgi:CubicO group peptidase (beta-lactamase class C family)